MVAACCLSLAGWRRHRSPGAGAASPVPELPHLPLPRGRGTRLRSPETRAARGVSPPGHPAAPQPRTPRPRKPRPLTRPHRGRATATRGHPQNGINERTLEAAASERGCSRGRGAGAGGRLGVQDRRGAPSLSGEAGGAAELGRQLPGARPHAEAQVGGEEGTGREGGSVTRFRAPPAARRRGPAPPRPAPGRRSRPVPPDTFLRGPASRSRSRAAGPAPPAPPLCAALRFPPPRLHRGRVTSWAPTRGSARVSRSPQVVALRKGGSPASGSLGEEQGGGAGTRDERRARR